MLCLDLYLVLVQSGSQTQPAPPPGEVSASSSHSDNTDQSSLTCCLSTGGRSGEQEERELTAKEKIELDEFSEVYYVISALVLLVDT